MYSVMHCDWCGYENVIHIEDGMHDELPQSTCVVCRAEFMLIQPIPRCGKTPLGENFWTKRCICDGTPGPHGVSHNGLNGVPV